MVLSAALIWFNPEEKPSYEQLLSEACMVKFDAKEQISQGRTVSKSTLDWWMKQHKAVKEASFEPKLSDNSVEVGFYILKEYINSKPKNNNTIVWARGNMDEFVINNLATSNKIETLFNYNQWRDVRTAVDCLTGSNNGYCNVKYDGFKSYNVIKHNPVHDTAYDIMQLLYGERVD